jgi:murein L,D-transpeptidase YcbB/YkuD
MRLRLNENQLTKDSLMIGEEILLGINVIKGIYKLNDYGSLWNKATTTQLSNEINKATALDGLKKQDYMLPGLELLFNKQQLADLNSKDRVELELALTESLLRLNYHLRFGKVEPVSLDSNWNYGKRLDFKNPMEALYQAIKNQTIKTLLNNQRPKHPYYHKLRKVLTHYREVKAAGGWDTIEQGPTIKLKHESKRILQVRNRLIKTDNILAKSITEESASIYNENLQQAIIRFQKKHTLDTDGKIGKKTLNALNKSVSERIDQVRVNLERLRWIMHEVEDEFLIVDIPGFEVILVKNGKREWQGKIQVGKAFTATPVFKGKLEYLEFNPTWTIPPSIIKRTVFPGLKKDASYLNKKGYLLLDFKGNKIDPLSVDWENVTHFPYIVRQPAGKDNALGQVKFIFPNPHFVFLHDTNHRELFSRNTRTFSSGCLRVEKPFELSEQLLKTTKGWNRKKIDQLVTSGKTQRIHPKDKISILITYTTVGMDENNKVRFKPDIYKRDNRVLAGLNGKVRIATDVQKALKKYITDSKNMDLN